jgi:hypothetical protein
MLDGDRPSSQEPSKRQRSTDPLAKEPKQQKHRGSDRHYLDAHGLTSVTATDCCIACKEAQTFSIIVLIEAASTQRKGRAIVRRAQTYGYVQQSKLKES